MSEKISHYYPQSKVEINGFMARYYDILLDTVTLGRYRPLIEKAIELMAIRPSDKILDLGSGTVTERHLAFYKRRACYLGAVIPEPLYIDKGLRELLTQMGIDSDDKIDGLKKLLDTIHQSGTKAIAHLNHPGRMANPNIPGNYFLSSTDRPCENGEERPRRMDREEMNKVISLFVEGAVRAKKAGFDLIELQFGHGYLLAQFISPYVNDRSDEFGGSFENRIKFPLQVLEAVLNVVDLPIIVRISGDEMIPEG